MSSNFDASIPTELYSLVLQFLKDAGLSQTAKIFKKEIDKSIKVVNQKYGLVEIFKSYNSLIAGKNIEKVECDDSSSNSGSNEENESNDESSSSSEDDDQSSEDEVDRVNESSDEKLKNDEMEDSRSSSSGDDNDSSDSSSIEEENNGNALSPGKESTSSDSSSSDSSSSDSNSSDSSSEQSENEEQSVKVSNVSEVSNESSSESLSSSSLSEDEEENGKMEIRSDNELVSSSSEESDREQGKSSNVKNNNKTDSNNNSDNESEESDSESEYESKPRNTQNNINNIEEHNGENGDKLFHSNGKITSTEIDKSESSSEKNSSYKMNVPLTNGNKLKHKLDSNNDTLDVKDYARPSKKLNSNVSVYFKPLSVYKNQRKNGNSNKAENKSNGNGNIYNRRINPEKVAFLDERLKDNSFLAKDGAIDSYGYKAHNDLFATRGKDFRAQKTKKKRGSYRGGKIDFESHSIKFAADD